MGSHAELLAQKGIYWQLVCRQQYGLDPKAMAAAGASGMVAEGLALPGGPPSRDLLLGQDTGSSGSDADAADAGNGSSNGHAAAFAAAGLAGGNGSGAHGSGQQQLQTVGAAGPAIGAAAVVSRATQMSLDAVADVEGGIDEAGRPMTADAQAMEWSP